MSRNKEISYVCDGAKLRCTFGDQESTLKIPKRFAKIDGKGQATIYDNVAKRNVLPFGRCIPHKIPCKPALDPAGWVLTQENVTIFGDPVLLKSSYLMCNNGGLISIVNSGCEGVTTGSQGLLSVVKSQEKEKKETEKALKKANQDREKNVEQAKAADKAKSEEKKGEEKEEPGSSGNEDDIRKKIVEAAKSLNGSAYVPGAEEKGRCDCSGSVVYSYRQAGINVPRLDAQGFHDRMTKIDKSQLKPGDIITYYDPNAKGRHITHVQVYIGTAKTKKGVLVNDAVLNAGSKETGVYITSLSNHLIFAAQGKTPYYGKLLP